MLAEVPGPCWLPSSRRTGEARRADRPAGSATQCRPAAVGTRRRGPVRLRWRQLLRAHGDHRRSVGDVPGPARLARRGVSRHPFALPREDARDGPMLVIEMLTVPGEPNPGIAVLDMMMLLYFGEARQRTVAEYSELFRATGLSTPVWCPRPAHSASSKRDPFNGDGPCIGQRRRLNHATLAGGAPA